jgi:hypothetical protein
VLVVGSQSETAWDASRSNLERETGIEPAKIFAGGWQSFAASLHPILKAATLIFCGKGSDEDKEI